MCMIVDVNVANKVFLPNDPDFGEVHDSLFTGKMPNSKIVFGGHLGVEYGRSSRLRRLVVGLSRAGKAMRINDDAVNRETAVVEDTGLCRSDDPHIIALARVSAVRLLCSHDKDLHGDFTNHLLLAKPRGKVYQNRSHNNLLRRFC
jgi:hypothetical protein